MNKKCISEYYKPKPNMRCHDCLIETWDINFAEHLTFSMVPKNKISQN